MRRLTIAIPDDAGANLAELARLDFRAPRHEAAALLIEAIERGVRRIHATHVRRRFESVDEDVGQR